VYHHWRKVIGPGKRNTCAGGEGFFTLIAPVVTQLTWAKRPGNAFHWIEQLDALYGLMMTGGLGHSVIQPLPGLACDFFQCDHSLLEMLNRPHAPLQRH